MNLAPLPIQKFFDNNGRPLESGLLFTYISGTTTKIATYTDASGGASNTNPIVLNFRGECRIWIDPTKSYTFVLAPRTDTDPPTNPIWTVNDITAAPFAFDNAAVDTGSVNNIQLAIPQISSPVAFTRIVFKAANTNTGAVTISINGGTAKSLTWQNLANLDAGEIQANGIYQAVFDGAQWQLQSPALQAPQMRSAIEATALVTPSVFVYQSMPRIDLRRYGLSTSASGAVNRAALEAAIDVAGVIGGAILEAPPGIFVIDATVTIDVDHVNIQGAGANATIWSFTPGAPDVLFHFTRGASSIVQCSIKGCGFTSGNSNNKTAIEIDDGRDCKVEEISISSSTWQGSGSIGLHTKGRDTLSVRKFHVLCARPIVIDGNTNHATLDCDHFHFQDMEIGSSETSGKCVEITDGTHWTNLTFDGYQAWELGAYGIYWNDTSTTQDSYVMRLIGIRVEQATDSAGYSVYLASTAQDAKAILMESFYFDNSRNGVFLRKPECASIRDSFFTGGAGRTNLDITFQSRTLLEIDNTEIPAASTVTLTNAVLVKGAARNTSVEIIPKTVEYRFDEGAVISQKPAIGYNDEKVWSYTGTLANGAQISTPFTRAAYTGATISVTAYSATGPIHSTGTAGWTKDGTTTKHGGSANFVAVAAGVAIWCVDGGSGLIVLNNLGQTVTLIIDVVGVV